MQFISHTLRSAVTAAVAVGAVLFTLAPAMAGNVNWSVGFATPGVQVGIAAPQRVVYVQPQPVYVQQQSVYVQPAPVYVQPQPVYQQVQPVYQQAYPVYAQPQVIAPVGYYPPVWGPGYGHHHHHHGGEHGGGHFR